MILKSLLAIVVFSIATLAHPAGANFGVLALLALLIFFWAWSCVKSRSLRVIPVLMMTALLWIAMSAFSDPSMDSAQALQAGVITMCVVYASYLSVLWLVDGFCDKVLSARPCFLQKYWWF